MNPSPKHTRPLLRPCLLAAALGAASLPGCGSGGPDGAASTWGEAWQRVRESVAIGRAYDRGLLAARDRNTEAFDQARRDLESLNAQAGARSLLAQAPLTEAEEEVARGIYWSTIAARASSPEQKAAAEEREAQSFRKALKLSPGGAFESHNAEVLNGLGYFLADKGRGKADFELAEKLTRRAISLQDADVKDARAKSGDSSDAFSQARSSRANTRDSLAWALFWQASTQTQQKSSAMLLLKKAQDEQEAALKEARAAAPDSISAELLYHMALILSAQNVVSPDAQRHEKAMQLLAEALQREPSFEPAKKAAELLS